MKDDEQMSVLSSLTSRLSPQWRWRILSRTLGRSEAARALGVRVGEGCRIISCQVRSEYDLLTIGDRVTVSSEVLFITHDGTGWLARDERGRRYKLAPIVVGDDSFIGARSTILPGVRIGSDCIVAAGAVVTKSVPSGSIVGGNPARIIGDTGLFRERALREWSSSREVSDQFRPAMDR